MKNILINAEPLDKQYAGIHYYVRLLRLAFDKYFPDYPVQYLRETKVADTTNDVYIPSHIRIQRDPYKHFIAIPSKVRKLKPDAYIEITHFGPFFLRKGTKRITVIHDLTPLKFPEYHPLVSAYMQRFFIKHTVRNADSIIVNSNNTRSDLLDYFPSSASKTKVIYPGIEDVFKPAVDEALLKKLGISASYFISLSTIEPRKNIETLLKAFTRFKDKTKSNHQLVLVGKGGWKNKTFYKILDGHPFRDSIVLTGYLERNELPALYSSADAFIFPSYYEGFGFPLLEALSCGTPCISSDTSSLPEVGGKAANYFNPHNTYELYDKMLLIYNNKALRDGLKEKSLKQAKNFTLEKFAKGFMEIIERM